MASDCFQEKEKTSYEVCYKVLNVRPHIHLFNLIFLHCFFPFFLLKLLIL